ncbi:3-ketosteroid-delta-1-dehydrogenase [Microlunatus elymi]|uniref:3-ketosteroid-delta-1-dehydrogenase n=1 Tax=Microlunatus elymi TaxID=2596828 RepID=A0A516PY00_9ACTN|nr:3-ketosteroid-delta-1-dehydrogenase [Microlunatus elymi]QDP96055.1 3-ketosteroid-delta-1-dehydrogenase [Microlunatus elymi]
MRKSAPAPATPRVVDTEVDVLVVGSGTGMGAALAAADQGLDTLIVEKTEYVGGSTALSGGGLWIPGNSTLGEAGTGDSIEDAKTYVGDLVGDSSPVERWSSAVDHGPAAFDLLRRTTPLRFMWAPGYSDYHPEHPGGSATGRTCEAKPFDAKRLKESRRLLRKGNLEAPVPMPVTSVDYRLMNLVTKLPSKGVPAIVRRAVQGIGGMAVGREYVAGGQGLAAGLYAGVLGAGIPIWTETALTRLITTDGRVSGAVLDHHGREATVTARRGVILATGGFDHNVAWRRQYQSAGLQDWSLGNPGNVGDGIRIAQEAGADTALMDQAWWFPSVAPLDGGSPTVLLAERSLPGSFMVDQHGRRFTNEARDYMSFGQAVIAREKAGDPITSMWLIFDQAYRNSYVFAAGIFPRQPLPKAWYGAGIAHRAGNATDLAASVGLPLDAFSGTFDRFNNLARSGVDHDHGRGQSAYDRYYGDPTQRPNPNLRALSGNTLYAVKVVLADLGTCGGVRADGQARALRADGTPIEGLYAIGNTAGNAYGHYYPGAGATIGQGLVMGYVAARHAARSAA